MKYIVLYTLTLLWITISDSAAQKPVIDLLPSTHRHGHPEAVFDTCSTHDSLVVVAAFHPSKPNQDNIHQHDEQGRDSLLPNRPGMFPLIFKTVFPIRFLIYNTALII
ncbi:MAG: hypothetical protein V2B15_04075 [Bacteroidota bacterium]